MEEVDRKRKAILFEGITSLIFSSILFFASLFFNLVFYSLATRGLLGRQNKTLLQFLKEKPEFSIVFISLILVVSAAIFGIISGWKFIKSYNNYNPTNQYYASAIRLSKWKWVILAIAVVCSTGLAIYELI